MRDSTQRNYRKWAVSAIVLAGHAVLVVLFARVREHDRTIDAASRSKLFLVEQVAAPRRPASLSEPQIATSTPIQVPRPRVDPQGSPAPESKLTSSPRIDWRGEAERSAHNAIRETAPPTRGFEERAAAAPPLRPHRFEWKPRQVGFAGGLPYVRLGKRCVIGLGFFGCGFGELPAANGKLFEDVNNPDRERSSVPSLDE